MPNIEAIGAGLWRFARFIFREYIDDNCQGTAAALTYQTLFAVVPLLTVMYSMFNTFSAFTGVANDVESLIFANIVPENVAVVQQYLTGFSDQARSLSIPSLLLLGVTAFLMLFTIERTFNDIWRIREPRHGFQRFLMYWAILTLGPFLLGFGFVISTYVVSLPLVGGVTEIGMLRYIPVLLSASLFTLLYLAVPNCVVPFRYGLTGGVLVAVAFEMAKVAFTKIMAGSNFEVIYGTFAAVPLFLLWIYLTWTIILVGAEIVKGLHSLRFKAQTHIESPLIQLLLILELYSRAHHEGRIVRDGDIRKLSDRVDISEWNDMKAKLVDLNLIRTLNKGGTVLTRNLRDVTVWDIYQHVPFDMPQTMSGQKAWETDLAQKLGKIMGCSQEYLQVDLETLFATGAIEQLREEE
jgi:membrane protein